MFTCNKELRAGNERCQNGRLQKQHREIFCPLQSISMSPCWTAFPFLIYWKNASSLEQSPGSFLPCFNNLCSLCCTKTLWCLNNATRTALPEKTSLIYNFMWKPGHCMHMHIIKVLNGGHKLQLNITRSWHRIFFLV